ncbi:MAG: Ku protein [Pseudomonadota bacterium]|nr:Ku protein [Pseudomonadota bacterium]
MAARPYWHGQIRLSLVSLPVNVYAALNRARQVPLHEMSRATGRRVHHQKIAEGEPVAREDLIRGYEYEKGEYVLLEPEEIAALKIPSRETLDIVQFVDKDEIDEAYFDAPYYVVPEGRAAEEAFAVIREALRDTGKLGIGQVAISGRERLCALKPYGKGMLLELLHYKDEVRSATAYFEDIADTPVDKDQLELAEELIRRKSAPFDPGKFHDHYHEALRELIDAKLGHRTPRAVTEEKPHGTVINLTDALRKSLGSAGKPSRPKPKPRSRRG